MFTKVLDNIYIVSPTATGNFPSSYSYYINDGVKTVIDTPLDPRFADYFKARPVDLIINTHFHRDHSGTNHLFPDAKIYAHPLDTPAMESAEIFCDYYGLNEAGNEYLKSGMLGWLNFEPSHISKHIEDGEIIDLGETKLEVIHTPGHTPGHCVLYDHERELLYSGDIDLTGFGPWYGNAVSNVDDFIQSIERVIKLKPKIILSGHKGVIDKNAVGSLKEYLQKIYTNEEKILQALASPLTLDELAEQKIIYGKWIEPKVLYAYFEKVSLERHLERLLRLDLVTVENGYYQAGTSLARQASCE